MTAFLPLAAAARALGYVPRIGIYFRMEMEEVAEPIRLWGGFGDCDPGVNALDEAAGATYSGLGELQDVPSFNQLLNGKAERAAVSLSGIDEEVFRLADLEADLVRDAFVAIGVGTFNDAWQVLDPVDWLWYGWADVLNIRKTTDGQKFRRVVELSLGSVFTGRSRSLHGTYTPSDQKSRSPDDRFCDYTPLYNRSTIKRWPDFG